LILVSNIYNNNLIEQKSRHLFDQADGSFLGIYKIVALNLKA